MRKALLLAATILALAAFASTFVACKIPPSGTWTGDAINCGETAVRDCFPSIVGSVNSCLVRDGDASSSSCLSGLIGPGVCSAEKVIACMVRRSTSSASADARINPGDTASKRMADNGRAFILERKYRFADDVQPVDGGAP